MAKTHTLHKSRMARKPMTNFQVRLRTALAFMPLAAIVVYTGGVPLAVAVATLAVLGALEFYLMAHDRSSQGSVLTGVPVILVTLLGFALAEPSWVVLAFALCIPVTFVLELLRHPRQVGRALVQVMTTLAGAVYIGLPAGFLIALRADTDGMLWLVLIFAVTWGTDTGAYFVGHRWGRRKLAPRLSPGKTVEGALGGIVIGFVASALILIAVAQATLALLVLVAVAPLAAIAGDLLESAIKRFFDIKDSHIAGLNIVPGHGGVLDRVDSLLLVTAWFYVFLALFG